MPPGTTTRAVYSLFGSKDGLLVEALARDAFEFLHGEIGKLEETDDPVSDLIDVGVVVFRRLVRDHPALYRIAFQRIVPGLDAGPELTATRQRGVAPARREVERLQAAGLPGDKTSQEARRGVHRDDGRASGTPSCAGECSGCCRRATRKTLAKRARRHSCADSAPSP